MKNCIKNVTKTFLIVLLLTFLGAVSNISFASNNGNERFLGEYIQYGIISNQINQTSDMETNFITGTYLANGQTNGNTVSEKKANASGTIKIGEVIGEYQFRGNPTVIIDKEVKKEVSFILSSIQSFAEKELKKETASLPDITDMNRYIIDVTEEKDTVYVDADILVNAINSGELQNGSITIRKKSNQTIILNTTAVDKVTIPRYQVDIEGNDCNKEEIAQNVIWNMPFANHLIVSSDNLHATLIAPQAYVNIEVTGEGWLVCDTIVNNNGEWHMISRKIPETTATPTLKETTTPKPTTAPIPTPTTTTTASPTISPTPFAANTPEATKEPTNPPTSAIPEITTEVMPSNKPVATPTPSPTQVSIPNNHTPLSLTELNNSKTPKTSATTKKSKTSKTTSILDGDVPLSDSAPETGDTFNVTTTVVVMFVSLIFIVVVIKINKK